MRDATVTPHQYLQESSQVSAGDLSVCGLQGLEQYRRDFLRLLGIGALLGVSHRDVFGASENLAVATTKYSLKYFNLPKNGLETQYPPEWGDVAKEILDVYPTNRAASPDQIEAKDVVRVQKQTMARLRVYAVSNAAHELTHALNSQVSELWGRLPDIANPRDETVGSITYHWNDVQGVYLGKGRIAFFDHPGGVTAQMIREKIPASVTGWDRYKLYLVNAMAEGSYHRAGYLVDELSAYCSGARTNFVTYDHFVTSNQIRTDGKDKIDNGHEQMAVFVLAMAMVADRNPRAFRNEERKDQFMAVVATLVESAVRLESQLSDEARFPEYSRRLNPRISLRDLLQNSADFREMRAWMMHRFGMEWYASLFDEGQLDVRAPVWKLVAHEAIK